jgi:hypothetical protein
MAREAAEDAREADDFKALRKAQALASASTTPTPSPGVTDIPTMPIPDASDVPAPLRMVLAEPARGRIVHLAVFEEVGELAVLRDAGLLDIISLADLTVTHHIDLDAACTSEKDRRRIPSLWAWSRVHLAAREEVGFIFTCQRTNSSGNTARRAWRAVA